MFVRLNIIEKYDSKENVWALIDMKLPEELSNNAALTL